MARRVAIRSAKLHTAVRQIEDMVAQDWKTLSDEHKDDLSAAAEWIVDDAKALSPVKTGALRNSIQARVSKSYRYPGLMVQASAKNPGKGFDYALIQEENESFYHPVGQAHYLSEPFYKIINDLYFERTGRDLDIPVVTYKPYRRGYY